jgi:hypothetical protein
VSVFCSFLCFHIIAQLSRIRIRQDVRKAGRYPTSDEAVDIERARLRVSTRIRDFHITSSRLLGPQNAAAVMGTPDQLNSDGYLTDDVRNPEDRCLAPSMSAVENIILAFPSSLSGQLSPFAQELRQHESRLRRAKANDTLGHFREKMSGLSYQYISQVRRAKTTKANLRSHQGVKLLTREVSFYQQVYNRNSTALGSLDADLKLRYPPLRRTDCKVNTAIADVNARGQSQVRLAWFWAAQDGWDGDTSSQTFMLDNDRLMECKPVSPTPNAVTYFRQSIESTGCGLGPKKIDGRKNYHERSVRWFGQHCTSCISETSGMTVFLNSGSAPTGSSVMRLTARKRFSIGKNLPEWRIFSSVQPIRISRRSGARLLLRHSMRSLMFAASCL